MRRHVIATIFGAATIGFVPSSIMAQGCPASGQQSSGPDVIVGCLSEINDIRNYNGESGLDAFALGTTSCNLGNQDLQWESAPDTDHPVISQNLFRLKTINGSARIEQIGMSWLKHGFAALAETNCCPNCQDPSDPSRLGVGCSDPYDASRNGGQFLAGPRWQINATTGIHIQPQSNPFFSGAMARRLQVHLGDLEDSTTMEASTKYFVEGQYIAADDAANGNKNNNTSYRRVSVVQATPTNYTFGLFGLNTTLETHRMKAGVQAWKDLDPSVFETDIITPEDSNLNSNYESARVILSAQATELGGGVWHYEYALQNMNSDRSIYSFSVPVEPGVQVTNIGFHDVDYHDGDGENEVTRDGTDWPGVRNSNDVTWACVSTFAQNPNANALRWGTMYNFRFDAKAAPWSVQGTVSLGQFKTVNTFTASSVVPGCHCPGDLNASGTVDGDDIATYVRMFVNNIPTSICADVATPHGVALDDDDTLEFTNLLLADVVCP